MSDSAELSFPNRVDSVDFELGVRYNTVLLEKRSFLRRKCSLLNYCGEVIEVVDIHSWEVQRIALVESTSFRLEFDVGTDVKGDRMKNFGEISCK